MTELVFEKDLNLTEMVWRTFGRARGEKLPPSQQHRWTETAEGDGEWCLSPHDVVRIAYRPPHPQFGLDRAAVMAAQRAYEKRTKEFMRDPREEALYHAMVGIRTEHAFAESMEEARMLCSTIEAGSDHLPPFEEGLAALGFEKRKPSPFSSARDDYVVYERTIKSGTFDLIIRNPPFEDLLHGSVTCHYSGHGCNHWHNVFNMEVDFPSHDKKSRCYVFWPEAAKDLRRIAVAHLGSVIEKRLARERTRISTPLGGKLPREF